ncbi:hypothetical protein ACFFYR_02045 [Paraburkholderia dipogonis]|uniref:hypothetical protein n=1 Tax=Paraburkholderia dipogonis TaxID=1211383 RepID=UPI0035F0CD09
MGAWISVYDRLSFRLLKGGFGMRQRTRRLVALRLQNVEVLPRVATSAARLRACCASSSASALAACCLLLCGSRTGLRKIAVMSARAISHAQTRASHHPRRNVARA